MEDRQTILTEKRINKANLSLGPALLAGTVFSGDEKPPLEICTATLGFAEHPNLLLEQR
jgi:hypothetical protein